MNDEVNDKDEEYLRPDKGLGIESEVGTIEDQKPEDGTIEDQKPEVGTIEDQLNQRTEP